MENFKNILKKTGRVSILESLIFAILGIILVWKPVGTVKAITWVLGSIFILTGIYKIIIYFKTKGENDFFNYDLVYGLMAIVIGIVAVAYIDIIGSIFRIIIGIWIIYSAFIRMNASVQIKKVNNTVWIYSLILAIIMFCFGLFILINSGAIVTTIGFIMIAYSIIDIIENVIFMKNIKEIF